jgi:hypothetical protein
MGSEARQLMRLFAPARQLIKLFAPALIESSFGFRLSVKTTLGIISQNTPLQLRVACYHSSNIGLY